MASFEVRVVNDDQEGSSHMHVRLEFTGLTRHLIAEEYTDSDGIAYFSGYDEGEVEVYINESSYGQYEYKDGASITITT